MLKLTFVSTLSSSRFIRQKLALFNVNAQRDAISLSGAHLVPPCLVQQEVLRGGGQGGLRVLLEAEVSAQEGRRVLPGDGAQPVRLPVARHGLAHPVQGLGNRGGRSSARRPRGGGRRRAWGNRVGSEGLVVRLWGLSGDDHYHGHGTDGRTDGLDSGECQTARVETTATLRVSASCLSPLSQQKIQIGGGKISDADRLRNENEVLCVYSSGSIKALEQIVSVS